MRIASAAMSFISNPSPKGNPFREGPKKDKKKSRLISKVLSAPIRRVGRQFSLRSSRNSPRKDAQERASKYFKTRDVEQGWIAPATTFETSDTISPRSFDTLTTGNSFCFSAQTEEKEEILACSIINSSERNDHDEILDLEVGFNESAEIAAPHVVTEIQEGIEGDNEKESKHEYPRIHDAFFKDQTTMIDDDEMASKQEDTTNLMVSLLSQIDTTQIIDEADEIDSLVPAADISFFLNEEEDDGFRCVGRLSTPQAEPPVEIDVDSIDDPQNEESPVEINFDCIDDLSKNSIFEDDNQVYIEDDDEISTGSYNSYLQAIENITASASSKLERAMMARDEIDIKTSYYKSLAVESEPEPVRKTEEDEECYRVSFNPSRELLLQAMEGASAKAKADIERATALALSKMYAARSAPLEQKTLNRANTTAAKYTPNRVLGFIFFLFLLLQFNGNSYQLFWGLRSMSQSIGIDEFQIIARNDIFMEPHSDRGMWGDKQIVANASKTQVSVNNERFYNVGCVNKIGCLALGNI